MSPQQEDAETEQVQDPDRGPMGEVPASTGGVVDLDRAIGTIPVVLVFLSQLTTPESRELVRSLGRHLVDFGHDRVLVLAVARVEREVAELVDSTTAGNARIVADTDGSMAERFGVSWDARATVVTIGEDGEVDAVWTDQADGTFADRLLEHLSELRIAG